MKKIYLSILAVALTLGVSAQNFSYPVGQNIVADVQNLNYEGYQIDINTPSFEAIHYEWEMVSNTFLADWSYSLCDYGSCAVGVPQSGSMTPITLAEAQSGVIGWFKMNLTVAQYIGSGKVELYVYDAADYNRGDVVSWDITWDGSQLTINETEINTVSFFPNPATDQISVNAEGDFTGVIYNSLGATVTQFNGSSTQTVDVSHLNSGIYYMTVNTVVGVSKQKLIIE
ncbi:MAG: T9SS type A sorting domain-containing protein [Crocinitomicaceae bacterium]|nr:T9SS type A sorting domain-containing protein [Crocinitomicaceae bacterium]